MTAFAKKIAHLVLQAISISLYTTYVHCNTVQWMS